MDMLEDEYDKRNEDKGSDDIMVKAINKLLQKLKEYYTQTRGLVYSITTGKFITYKFLYIYILLI